MRSRDYREGDELTLFALVPFRKITRKLREREAYKRAHRQLDLVERAVRIAKAADEVEER